MSEFKQYKRTQIAEMKPVSPDDTVLTLEYAGISVSDADIENGSPKSGDMIARNPNNHNDQWLVAKAYFEENFEPIEEQSVDNQTANSFFWKLRSPDSVAPRPVAHGDVRRVLLPVTVIVEKTDKVIADYDYDNEEVLEYEDGLVLRVCNDQTFLYRGQKTKFIGSIVMGNKQEKS